MLDANRCHGKLPKIISSTRHTEAYTAHVLYEKAVIATHDEILNDAEILSKESISIMKKIHGQAVDHPDIAGSLHLLGNICKEKGMLSEAREWNKDRIYGQGSHHPEIAASLLSLGCTCKETGMLSDAEKFYKQSMDLNKRIHGKNADHLEIANSSHQLGSIFELRERLDKAEKWYKLSVEMRKRLLGQGLHYPNIALSLQSLGRVCEQRVISEECKSRSNQSLQMGKGFTRQAGKYCNSGSANEKIDLMNQLRDVFISGIYETTAAELKITTERTVEESDVMKLSDYRHMFSRSAIPYLALFEDGMLQQTLSAYDSSDSLYVLSFLMS